MSMFCFQCEQTANGTGCVELGTCGKDPETVALYEEAAERARLYSKLDGPGCWVARGKLDVMEKQRETRE